MSKKIKESANKLLKFVKDNTTELWTGLCLYVGVPIAVTSYLDFRAGFAVFVLISTAVGLIALSRNKE